MLSRGGERHVRAFLLFRGTSQNLRFFLFPLFTIWYSTSQLLKKYYFVFAFFNVFFFSDEDDAFFIAFALE
jgi:hypothetical protein